MWSPTRSIVHFHGAIPNSCTRSPVPVPDGQQVTEVTRTRWVVLAAIRHDKSVADDGEGTKRRQRPGPAPPRQQEVLALMAQGRTNASIARSLSITERAVVQHTSHIYDELDIPANDDDRRRVLAVTRYLAE